MNPTIEAFARKQIKDSLSLLPEENIMVFKMMYAHKNLDWPIDKVVDAISAPKLDWALTQVENTLRKANKSQTTAGTVPQSSTLPPPRDGATD